MNRRHPVALLPLMLVAACGGSSGDSDHAAQGQVLRGTISDAMIPLDTLRSQPPLARSREAGEGKAASTAATGNTAPAVSDEAPAAAATADAGTTPAPAARDAADPIGDVTGAD